jgi:hypothetical protein
MSRPTRRDDIGRDVEEVFSIAVKGIWGTDKLRIKTNIRRVIARPDACGVSNRRSARSGMSVDQSIIIARWFGVAARTLSEVEVRE